MEPWPLSPNRNRNITLTPALTLTQEGHHCAARCRGPCQSTTVRIVRVRVRSLLGVHLGLGVGWVKGRSVVKGRKQGSGSNRGKGRGTQAGPA